MLVRLGGDCPGIERRAFETHGISQEDLNLYGVSIGTATNMFLEACGNADVLVAHNLSFDRIVMSAALHRASSSSSSSNNEAILCPTSNPSLQYICTKELSTEVLKLPGKYGNYKWPTLQEAYTHFGGEVIDGAHDALVDSEACLFVLKGLVDSGTIKLEGKEVIVDGENSNYEGDDIPTTSVLDVTNLVEESKPVKKTVKRQKVVDFMVTGKTFSHKEKLRKLGGIWNPREKGWQFNQSSEVFFEVQEFADSQPGLIVAKFGEVLR